MFEDSLLESGNRLRTQRGKTTAVSFALQGLALGMLVLLPLIHTDALPRLQMLTTMPAVPAPAPRRGSQPTQRPTPVASELQDGRLVAPIEVPPHALSLKDPALADAGPIGVPWGVEHSTGPIGSNSTLVSVLTTHPAPPPPEPRVERLVISRGVTEGHLVRRVAPEYPIPAHRNRIEGDVLLRAVIGRDGSIENISVMSGHPFLTRAAIEAVAQWRYQPFLLNGRAVEVDTQILVRFRFTRN